jgi:tetratricopeptide (TPR) repeat protein
MKSFTDNRQKKNPVYLIIWLIVIIIITFIVFSPGLQNDLVNWDDYGYIKDNSLLRSITWNNAIDLFSTKTVVMGNYHPLTILIYALEYKIAGPVPFIYHIVNILLHLANIILFAWLMWLLTKKYYAVVFASVLFAIHPMRVESVIWASELKDVLYTFFLLLALIFYVRFLKGNNRKVIILYVITLILFIFSLLSKAQAVVFPLLLFLTDYWFNKRITIKSLTLKLPFIVLSFVFGLIAIGSQATSLTSERLVFLPFSDRILVAGYNISAYLYKLIMPYNLSCFYRYPLRDDYSAIYAGCIILLIIITFLVIRLRNNKTIMFGALFFLFTIFIVIQLLSIGNSIIADRYTYLPYAGLFFVIGNELDTLLAKSFKFRKAVMVLFVLQSIIFAYITFIRAKTWKNGETLWEAAIKNDPGNALAYNNLGNYYLDINENNKAIEALEKSVQYGQHHSGVYNAYYGLGRAFKRTGKPEKAVQYFDKSLLLAPWYHKALTGRGLTLIELGQYDSAISDFNTILNQYLPGDAETYNNRALAYYMKQMPDNAISDYKKAIAIKPDYDEAWVNLGRTYLNQSKPGEAISSFIIGIKYISNEKNKYKGNTYMNLSFAYYLKKDYINALKSASCAQELHFPVNESYINNLKSLISDAGLSKP